MAFQAQDPDFEARGRESFARPGGMRRLGAALTRVEPGIATIELGYRPELTQQHGFFHAGMTATIADSAAGYAAYSLFPVASSVLTVEFKINLVAPADGERLVATRRVKKPRPTPTLSQVAGGAVE